MIAYYFGWPLKDILNLSPIQLRIFAETINEINKQKYGSDENDELKREAMAKVSEQKAKYMSKKMKQGKKLTLEDL